MKKILSRALSAAFLIFFLLSVPAYAATSPVPAQETIEEDQSEAKDDSVSPAIIAVIFILPVVSIVLTIGTAVIVLHLHKPSPPDPSVGANSETGADAPSGEHIPDSPDQH